MQVCQPHQCFQLWATHFQVQQGQWVVCNSHHHFWTLSLQQKTVMQHSRIWTVWWRHNRLVQKHNSVIGPQVGYMSLTRTLVVFSALNCAHVSFKRNTAWYFTSWIFYCAQNMFWCFFFLLFIERTQSLSLTYTYIYYMQCKNSVMFSTWHLFLEKIIIYWEAFLCLNWQCMYYNRTLQVFHFLHHSCE